MEKIGKTWANDSYWKPDNECKEISMAVSPPNTNNPPPPTLKDKIANILDNCGTYGKVASAFVRAFGIKSFVLIVIGILCGIIIGISLAYPLTKKKILPNLSYVEQAGIKNEHADYMPVATNLRFRIIGNQDYWWLSGIIRSYGTIHTGAEEPPVIVIAADAFKQRSASFTWRLHIEGCSLAAWACRVNLSSETFGAETKQVEHVLPLEVRQGETMSTVLISVPNSDAESKIVVVLQTTGKSVTSESSISETTQ